MEICDLIVNNKRSDAKIEIRRRCHLICECIIVSRIYRKALPLYSSELKVCVAKALDSINNINWNHRFSRKVLTKDLFYPSIRDATGVKANQRGYYNFSFIKTPILASHITRDCLDEIEKLHSNLQLIVLEALLPSKHLDVDDWCKLLNKIW